MDLGLIFFTGLTIGGLTCLAVQGGLLASLIASREKDDLNEGSINKHTLAPIFVFIISKFIAYTILGFLLGVFGSVLSLSQTVQIIMQAIAALYMIAVALNLLNVHPIFRYVIIQPPKFLTRLVRNQSKSKDIFAPALLGAMTVFIPCGTTLAMEALAISQASAFKGLLIMSTFILGTIPMFFGIGYITTKMGDTFKLKFLKLAAFAVLFLGLNTLNGSLTAWGSPITFQKIADSLQVEEVSNEHTTYVTEIKDGYQSSLIEIKNEGYYPSKITLQKDVPTKLTLSSSESYSCALAFRIPQLKMGVNLKPTDTKTLDLPALKKGNYSYTCSMGMYRGVIEVK